MSKADIIREAIRENPGKTPKEITEILLAQDPRLKISPNEISTYKSIMKKQTVVEPKVTSGAAEGAEVAESPEPAGAIPETNLADKLLQLKEIARSLGGNEETKRLLDILK